MSYVKPKLVPRGAYTEDLRLDYNDIGDRKATLFWIGIAKRFFVFLFIIGQLMAIIWPPILLNRELNELKKENEKLKKDFDNFRDFAKPILVDYQVQVAKDQDRSLF